MAKYLIAIYTVTAGLHEELGCDEQEIVLFSWVVVDLTNTKVVAAQTHMVKPRGCDVNENALSEACKTELGLSEEQVKTGQPLEQVVEQLDQFVQAKLGPDNAQSFHLVTDGQMHLRQVLHPEASQKNINLPHYYYSFFDLRKEFRKFYNSEEIHSIQDMLNFVSMESDASAEFSMQQVQNISKIILRLVEDGYTFETAEQINTHLEPGIW
ncbi:epithelial splicing regulatory protein 1 [Trichonephila clavata]|uniref:Epithelial splicing regulatory protein 1 n=1 Tax=Trichonephila clavata TaxID=2740835 RepID=A0A8X6KY01_TRICU|nr:epithelial splicing regulatory protein 1 [Trichonephila clavata]